MNALSSIADSNYKARQRRTLSQMCIKLAEHCKFGALKDEMIRDCIVVGIRYSKLSERLQLDPDLMLAKTITQVRQQENVRKQQQLLRGTRTEIKGANVDGINTNRGRTH